MGDLLKKITSVGAVEETVPVDLGEFHKSYAGAVFEVWVTPSQAHIDHWGEIRDWLEGAGKRAQGALEELDRQHEERMGELREADEVAAVLDEEKNYQVERKAFNEGEAERLDEEWQERTIRWYADTWLNLSLDEARQIRDHLREHNPRAWDWLTDRTQKAIGEYRRRTLGN